ncbi:MAG: hypothetical protein LC135_02465 [Phycisphaerae bacterium]|nr:hypothetical protein [Phycisphaerae bacterium]MCZ2398717.1 hypothetical protein [Phycisphaerae bacterium]NUQ49647.1 hypothetical protein [Phycisphaerae bacterium]
MPEQNGEIRHIDWRAALPFVRLLNTTQRALQYQHLLLGLAAVVCCYVAGRLLDGLWGSGGVVVVAGEAGPRNEIEAFATMDHAAFVEWRREAAEQRHEFARQSALTYADGEAGEVEKQLERGRPERLLTGGSFSSKRSEANAAVNRRLQQALAGVDSEAQLTREQKQELRWRLRRAADVLRTILAGKSPERFSAVEQSIALPFLLNAVPAADDATKQLLTQTVGRAEAVTRVHESAPKGVFITLLAYEMDCFAAAVQGVVRGRLGYGGPGLSREPSLLGGLTSAASGVVWLVTQRPFYAILYGALHLLIFTLFGTAICRGAAILAVRGETPALPVLLTFSRQKLAGCVLAVATPVAGAFLVALLMWLGGLVGALPWVGSVLAGLFYFLAILGGAALAAILILAVMGYHLVWPTIAVEGSDGFDAAQHAVGYVFQRGWHVGFYSLVLLVYGAVSFCVMRLLALLTLKFAHAATAAGMSWFGAWSSAATDTIPRLDALWRMPAWSELSLLPTVGGTPFWGEFATAPLSLSEGLACLLLRFWVFLVVGLLGAFVVSFYACGSTAMYTLLRKSCDAVDYDELYYEDQDDDFFSPPEPQTPGGSGVALPVVAPNKVDG